MQKDPELIARIKSADTAGALALLAAHPEAAAARDTGGISALMWSLYMRQPEVSEALRASLPELDLFEAVSLGVEERVAEVLADRPAVVDARSRDGFTALHLAAFFAQPWIAARLIGAGADLAAVADNAMRVQPLHSAAAARSIETCRVLLEGGADANAAQHQGWTALMAAAMHGDADLCELLLAHGADLLLRSDDGRTAAQLASEKGHQALAARLSPGSSA